MFVRPDATAGQLSLPAVQAEVARLLALDEESAHGFAGMDAEIPCAALAAAPLLKVHNSSSSKLRSKLRCTLAQGPQHPSIPRP